MTSTLVVQQYDSWTKEWEPVKFSKIRYNDGKVVLGETFRILVDGKEVHREGKAKV